MPTNNRVKIRIQGNVKAGRPVAAFSVPAWAIREVANEDDLTKAFSFLRGYEYLVEVTKEGILYRPVKVEISEKVGW